MFTSFDPIYEKKVWGNVLHIFNSPTAAVSLLNVDAGFCCSIHKHDFRDNLFAVQTGCVVVQAWPGGLEGRSHFVELTPGSVYIVQAPIIHRFRVLQSGIMTEVYSPSGNTPISRDDIIRYTEGGVDPVETIKKEMRGVIEETAL